MSIIKQLWAREILDSRGTPTIEAACQLDSGHVCVNSVPSGASTGAYEALELRDKDPQRYYGKGVLKAVDNVNNLLAPKIIGQNPVLQVQIDSLLNSFDKSENKINIGANTLLSVSELVAKAGALSTGISLYSWINKLAKDMGINREIRVPTPFFNMINGGLHGAGNLDFQEFHVIPSSSKSYSQGLQSCVEIYMKIKENLVTKGAIHSVGDEGGFAPNLFTNADALEILVESIKQTKYTLGRDVLLGIDVAASVFHKNGLYFIRDKSTPINENSLIEYFRNLNEQYHLSFLEDPLNEDSWEGWKKITALFSSQLTIVGDDLLATNLKRVEKAINEKCCNGILVKPNQIGTVTETLQVIKKAHLADWKIIVSHRSGETNDYFIADFAVGVGADHVKFGGPARGERVAKYNRLLSIEKEISFTNG